MAQQDPKKVVKVNKYLDDMKHKYGFRHDTDLGRKTGLLGTQLAHLRSGRVAFGPSIILRFHEKLGEAVADVRKAIG